MPERDFLDDHCANCLAPLPEEVDGLYCGELCEQTAGTIRWWRRKLTLGEVDQPDIHEALRTRIAHILAGGYHDRARTLPPETRALVWSRDGGSCVQCGQPGAEVDHIDGDSGDLTNLQLLCRPCHHAKTAGRFVPASEEDKEAALGLFLRAHAPVPSLLCDDEVGWPAQHHGLRKARRQRLLDQLTDAGVDTFGFKPRTPRRELLEALHDGHEAEAGATEDYDGGFGADSYFARAMARDD